MNFEQWFSSAFGAPVPSEFAEYLRKHPEGMENGYGPRLWTADAIQDETEEQTADS
jgi:hypothetical protein